MPALILDGLAAEVRLLDNVLATMEITYRLPDHPSVLQEYIWQDYDLLPDLPKAHGFLAFWERELDGPLYRVKLVHSRLVRPHEIRRVDGVFRLN